MAEAGKGSKTDRKPALPDITVQSQITATTEIKDLRPKSYFEPDRITILSGKDSERMSAPQSAAVARRVANEEFERFMLSHVKVAPSEPPKPPAVVPNAATADQIGR